MTSINLYFDGATNPGNPGPSGAGWYIEVYKIKNKQLFSKFKGYVYLGIHTNNEAEYSALINGLKSIINKKIPDLLEIKVYGDSQLVIKQMTGKYKVNSKNLISYYDLAKRLDLELKLSNTNTKISYHWIQRSENTIADDLSKKALER